MVAMQTAIEFILISIAFGEEIVKKKNVFACSILIFSDFKCLAFGILKINIVLLIAALVKKITSQLRSLKINGLPKYAGNAKRNCTTGNLSCISLVHSNSP
jgi:hypothetical protein